MRRIAITGGAGQIAYSLLFRLAHGDLFGNEKVTLHLLDLPEALNALKGLQMELEDCAFPLLHEVVITSDPLVAFKEIDIAFLIGAKPRGQGMERGDLLKENAKIFVEQGKALNKVASEKTRVLVVGNPCNTNALIAMHNAPRIPKQNFHAMLRLDHNRAEALLAKKANVSVDKIKSLTVWGNHSSTQVPDYTHVTINGRPLQQVITDTNWLQGEFFETVQKRGAAIIAARGKSSAASAASAAIDAVRALYTPTAEGDFFTSGVLSDGNPYGIEKNLIFGFPCRSKGNGEWEFVNNLPLDTFIREKIALTQKELIEERQFVEGLLK